MLDEKVVFLNVWFKDTLPHAPIEKLAILRLDGDMYESTIQALDTLYPKLSPGGFVIIDDYILIPCRKAVDDFRARNGIADIVEDIDGIALFWRKNVKCFYRAPFACRGADQSFYFFRFKYPLGSGNVSPPSKPSSIIEIMESANDLLLVRS